MDNTLHYCIQIDLSLLSSGPWDICQEKFIKPLVNSNISFTKLIHEDFTIVDIIQTIIKEYKAQAYGYELSVKSWIMKLFSLLIRDYSINGINSIKVPEHSTELNHVRKITSYISEYFNQPITLQILAQKCDISIPYMCRIFKKFTGSTIIEYINLLRCQKALSLLAGGYSIIDAALSVGFNDSNYFSRTFKKLFGISPSKAIGFGV
jgi:AraC-like DNA-binding protein